MKFREESARRKLDKTLHNLARDREGGTGNARRFHKATRTYGRAIIDAALEDMAVDNAEAKEPCIMCDKLCVSLCCSKACHEEAIRIGVINADILRA